MAPTAHQRRYDLAFAVAVRRPGGRWSLLPAVAAIVVGYAVADRSGTGAVLLLIGLAVAVGLVALVVRRPDLLVPAIVVATPLEITRVWIPFLRTTTDFYGEVSLLDAGRIVMLLAAAVWIGRGLATGRLRVPRDATVVWTGGLLVLGALSLTYTLDPARGLNEVVRLAFNWLLMVVVATFASSTRRVEVAAWTWVAIAAILAVVAIGQYATGVAFWNAKLQEGELRRSSATFADPNTFGSFLNVGIAFGLAFMSARGERLWLWAGLVAVIAAGLVATFSRSGWLALGLMIVVWGVGFARTARAAALFGALLAAGLAIVAATPALLDRLQNLDSNEALSVRPALVRVGLLIFQEHPLLGIGIGSFQRAVSTTYSDQYPFWAYVSASHTSFVTTAAELGVVGLALVAGSLATGLWRGYRLAVDRALAARSRAIGRALVLATLALIVAGQSTGALFEEPFVWIVFGLAIALPRALARPTAAVGAR